MAGVKKSVDDYVSGFRIRELADHLKYLYNEYYENQIVRHTEARPDLGVDWWTSEYLADNIERIAESLTEICRGLREYANSGERRPLEDWQQAFNKSTRKSKPKTFADMVNSIRQSGKANGMIKNKICKSSGFVKECSELRDCLLRIAGYFYDVGAPITNQFVEVSDELYYLIQNCPIEKRKVMTPYPYLETYEVPDSISEEFRLANSICDDLLSRLHIEKNTELRDKANELFGKIKYLINATSKED